MVVVDLDGRILRANAALAEMLRRPAEELEQTDVYSVTHPDDRPHIGGNLAEVAQGRAATSVAKRYLRGDGTVMWALLTRTPLVDEEGNVVAGLGQITDVTELK